MTALPLSFWMLIAPNETESGLTKKRKLLFRFSMTAKTRQVVKEQRILKTYSIRQSGKPWVRVNT